MSNEKDFTVLFENLKTVFNNAWVFDRLKEAAYLLNSYKNVQIN